MSTRNRLIERIATIVPLNFCVLIYRTYAVGVCREFWRDWVPSGCPSKIASFWPVSATLVAETGQKGRSRARLHRPRTPPRKSCDIVVKLTSEDPKSGLTTHYWCRLSQ